MVGYLLVLAQCCRLNRRALDEFDLTLLVQTVHGNTARQITVYYPANLASNTCYELPVHEIPSRLLTEGHFVLSAVVALELQDTAVESKYQIQSKMETCPAPDVLAFRRKNPTTA